MDKITRSQVGITTYLIPGASLNGSANVEQLRETIDACVADNEFELILDLSGVGVVNSEALELLLDTQDRLTRVGGQIRVTHANAVITDVLRLTGVAAVVGSLDEDAAPATEPARDVGGKWRRIGELLVARGLVTESQVQEALELQQ
jgi:anti-anti-sigma factor